MQNIEQEEAIKRFDSLPEHLRETITSQRNVDTIWDFGEANHISEAKIKRVADITGAVILGFVHDEDLQKELASDVGLPQDIAGEFSKEIYNKILAPVIEEIRSLYHWGTHVPPQKAKPTPETNLGSQSATTPRPQPKEKSGIAKLLNPVFKEIIGTPNYKEYGEDVEDVSETTTKPGPTPQPQQQSPAPTWTEPIRQSEPIREESPSQPTVGPAPFILHKEEQIEPLARERMSPLDRPQFFRSTVGDKQREKPSTARLEIGEEAPLKAELVGKTKEETPRVVNYTGPAVQVDPFERPNTKEPESAPPAPKEEPPKEVPPENTVNLKDLPR